MANIASPPDEAIINNAACSRASGTGFMSLPAELRNEIYEIAIDAWPQNAIQLLKPLPPKRYRTLLRRISPCDHEYGAPCSDECFKLGYRFTLLALNCQVRSEVLSMLKSRVSMMLINEDGVYELALGGGKAAVKARKEAGLVLAIQTSAMLDDYDADHHFGQPIWQQTSNSSANGVHIDTKDKALHHNRNIWTVRDNVFNCLKSQEFKEHLESSAGRFTIRLEDTAAKIQRPPREHSLHPISVLTPLAEYVSLSWHSILRPFFAVRFKHPPKIVYWPNMPTSHGAMWDKQAAEGKNEYQNWVKYYRTTRHKQIVLRGRPNDDIKHVATPSMMAAAEKSALQEDAHRLPDLRALWSMVQRHFRSQKPNTLMEIVNPQTMDCSSVHGAIEVVAQFISSKHYLDKNCLEAITSLDDAFGFETWHDHGMLVLRNWLMEAERDLEAGHQRLPPFEAARYGQYEGTDVSDSDLTDSDLSDSDLSASAPSEDGEDE